MKRIRLIVNPVARGDGASAGEASDLASGRPGWEVEVVHTEIRGHGVLLAEAAAGAGVDLVGAVGGDRTAREVAAGLARSPTPMLIVPAGTGNSSYRELFGALPPTHLLAAPLDAPPSPPLAPN